MDFRVKLGKFKKKLLYGYRATSDSMITYMKKLGVSVGNGCIFFDPSSCSIDLTNPELLKLGNNVRITHGVTILTHDYSWSVISGVYGECLGGVAPVEIGNNVFIGTGAIILKNVVIGDNVIIGAGSIVTKSCEKNSIYAGNPARKILTLEEWYYKRQKESYSEALRIAYILKNKDRNILKRALREYEVLYKGDENNQIKQLFNDTGYYEKCHEFYKGNISRFDSIEDLILAAIETYSRGKSECCEDCCLLEKNSK